MPSCRQSQRRVFSHARAFGRSNNPTALKLETGVRCGRRRALSSGRGVGGGVLMSERRLEPDISSRARVDARGLEGVLIDSSTAAACDGARQCVGYCAAPNAQTPRPSHVPQKTAKFGNKDRRNRPRGADFLLGSVSSTVPENRSVMS